MKKLIIIPLLAVTSCGYLPQSEQKLEDNKELMQELNKVDVPTIEHSLLTSAQAAMKAGDYEKAGTFFQQLIQRAPENTEYQFAFAEAARKVGDCKTAIPVYDLLIKKSSGNIEYQEGKALCQLANGDFQPAGELFTRIIQADSSRWRSINGAGIIFAIKKKFTEANQYFDLAAEVSNQNPAVLTNKGLCQAIMGNYKDAIKTLRSASSRADRDTAQKRQVDLNLALVLGISGDLDGAKEVAQKNLSEPQLYNNMGIYAELAKKPQLARTYLNKALTGTNVYYDKAWDNLQRLDKGN